MMCWFCITTEENLTIIKRRTSGGVPERHKNSKGKGGRQVAETPQAEESVRRV